ncbi:MAG: YaaL family protein [Lachnospiraceae bacterium]
MKAQFSQSSYQDTEQNSLLDDIAKTKYALEIAYSGFDYVVEPDLIDSYIYQVNAILKRYRYLLEEAARINLLPDPCLCQESSVVTLAREVLC